MAKQNEDYEKARQLVGKECRLTTKAYGTLTGMVYEVSEDGLCFTQDLDGAPGGPQFFSWDAVKKLEVTKKKGAD